MASALSRAKAGADRMYLSARATRGASPARALLSGMGIDGTPFARYDLIESIEQLGHYTGMVWSAVSAIARRAANQSVMVAKTKGGRKNFSKAYLDSLVPIETHPLISTVERPNPLMCQWGLMFSTVSAIKLTGKAFWWWAKTDDGQHELWPLPASWMWPDADIPTEWTVRPLGPGIGIPPFTVSAENIIQFSIPDPSNPFISISPLQTQSRVVAADEAMEQARASAFTNGIYPSMAVIAGDPTSDGVDSARPLLFESQREQIITAMRKLFSGPQNYGKFVILDALIRDIKPISNRPAEMGFLESAPQLQKRILQAFNVPAVITGDVENANRATALVAEENFLRQAVNPVLRMMSQILDRWATLAFGPGITAWFEECATQDVETTLAQYKLGLQTGCVTRNEFRRRVLGLPSLPGADAVMVPENMEETPIDGDQLAADDDEDELESQDDALGDDESEEDDA